MPRTALILSAGPGIGAHCISLFGAAGYNVVAASRSRQDNLKAPNHLDLHLDLSEPDTLPELFAKVRVHFEHPSVVIYNGFARTLVSPEDPLASLSKEGIEHDMAVNITSALIAAREAVKGWKQQQATREGRANGGTFIYTGNKQNVMADPKALTFGMAKCAAAKMMWDCSVAYAPSGFRFYFTDQRKADGSPARTEMDPIARAALYVELAEDGEQQPWHYTFVKGIGYVDFRSQDHS